MRYLSRGSFPVINQSVALLKNLLKVSFAIPLSQSLTFPDEMPIFLAKLA